MGARRAPLPLVTPDPRPHPRTARIAVSALFFVSGGLMSSVAPRLPVIRDALHLSNTELGLAVAAGPLGGLIAGMIAGALVARLGSGRLAVATGFLAAASLVPIGVAPAWALLAGAFFVLGASDATLDVAMNSHGLRVQEAYGRSILHSLHGFWSVGSLVGGATGALAAAFSVPVAAHLLAVGAVLSMTALVAGRHRLPDDVAEHHPHGAAPGHPVPPRRLVRNLRLALVAVGGIAVMALLTGFIEDTPSTWSSIFLVDAIGGPVALAGAGYVAWATAMVVSRLTSDRFVDRYGSVVVVRFGALLAAAGLLVVIGSAAVAGGSAPIAIAGFALLGIASGPIFPALFDAAGSRPGIPRGDGVAIITWTSRAGFFLAPALVGITADAAGLPAAIAIPMAAGLGIALLAPLLRRRPA